MIPSVFISSTVSDLRHVRDAVRSTVEAIGYRPVMSEYGDIGYMGGSTAEEACYKTIPECQILVLIVGKHYGSRSKANGAQTVTEMEFDEGMKHCAHIITLVDQEVLEFKKVYDDNPPEKQLSFPGMNAPAKTFAFISRISQLPSRNAIVPFSNASDVHRILRLQFASLVYELLMAQPSKTMASLNDILSEVKTLREAMTKNSKPDVQFLAAIRFLLDDENAQLRNIVKHCCSGSIESAIPKIVESDDIEAFLTALNVKYSVDNSLDDAKACKMQGIKHFGGFCPPPFWPIKSGEKPKVAQYAWCEPDGLVVNQVALEYYQNEYKYLKRCMMIANNG